MFSTRAGAGALALALALLALPASAEAAGSAPLLATSQETLSVLAGWEAGFNARATDPDGDAVTLSWAFDDGAVAGNVEHAAKAWEAPGTHVAMVTATDATGLSSTHSFASTSSPIPTTPCRCPRRLRPASSSPMSTLAPRPSSPPGA